MEHSMLSPRNDTIISCLICLPEKMLAQHNQDNLTEFVLHDLCKKDCFNLQKAAYFVDNPDFDCFKGIAGYKQDEVSINCDHWNTPQEFAQCMRQSPFNTNVRDIHHRSVRRNSVDEQKLVNDIAEKLLLQNPRYYSWGMKHDNHGVFIFELNPETESFQQQLHKGLSLLGFCPIF